jgi:PQQ-dependent catabolism-associated CXXCW motif protein
LATLIIALAISALTAELPPPEPQSYRLDEYRAPTPATLKGATVLDTPHAFEIWRNERAVFVDVLGHPPRPAGIPADVVWRDPKRFDIPGSIWLPETGYGELSPALMHYFESGLAKVTVNDKSKWLVLYCRPDCWASWNAAKRALSLGYTNVYWYPAGADGWSAAGHPIEERSPVPGQPQ